MFTEECRDADLSIDSTNNACKCLVCEVLTSLQDGAANMLRPSTCGAGGSVDIFQHHMRSGWRACSVARRFHSSSNSSPARHPGLAICFAWRRCLSRFWHHSDVFLPSSNLCCREYL